MFLTWLWLLCWPNYLFAGEPQLAGHTGVLIRPPTNLHIVNNAADSNPATFTNGMESLDDAYRLAIGDRLSFQIIQDREAPKSVSVTDAGDIEVPYLGRVPAEGRTCKELARTIKTELDKDSYYDATVMIAVDLKTKSRGRVYLVGAVRMPGPEEIPSDEVLTVSKAIMRAGGFGDFADKRNVRITRKVGGLQGTDQILTVDVGQVLEKGRSDNDQKLEPGDLIYVPDRLIRF